MITVGRGMTALITAVDLATDFEVSAQSEVERIDIAIAALEQRIDGTVIELAAASREAAQTLLAGREPSDRVDVLRRQLGSNRKWLDGLAEVRTVAVYRTMGTLADEATDRAQEQLRIAEGHDVTIDRLNRGEIRAEGFDQDAFANISEGDRLRALAKGARGKATHEYKKAYQLRQNQAVLMQRNAELFSAVQRERVDAALAFDPKEAA